MILLVYCLQIIFIFVGFSIVVYSLYNGIGPMPSSHKARLAMLESLNDLEPDGKIYELGSGWGSLAFPLAQNLPNCHIKAYENSLIPFVFSRCLKLFSPHRNLEINRNNFHHISLEEADIIVCYLHPGAMEKLKIKFENELSSEALVISNAFAVPCWNPQKIIEIEDFYKTKIYIYRKDIAKLY